MITALTEFVASVAEQTRLRKQKIFDSLTEVLQGTRPVTKHEEKPRRSGAFSVFHNGTQVPQIPSKND
jgi:hypothetical protein